jgi:hypothetical protein
MFHDYTNRWDPVLAFFNILAETTIVKLAAVKFLRIDHNNEIEKIVGILTFLELTS